MAAPTRTHEEKTAVERGLLFFQGFWTPWSPGEFS
jgi:hypothetical protein